LNHLSLNDSNNRGNNNSQSTTQLNEDKNSSFELPISSDFNIISVKEAFDIVNEIKTNVQNRSYYQINQGSHLFTSIRMIRNEN
jgi:hypothetical protein